MAIVIPVAMDATQVASRAGEIAQRKSIALRLAEGMLEEMVVDGSWRNSSQSGAFGEGLEGYEWRIYSEGWGDGDLSLVTVEVIYPVRTRQYSIVLSTLAPPEEAAE